MATANKTITVTRRQLIYTAWRRGLLSYKLQKHQPMLYEAIWKAIRNRSSLKHFVNCSRRFGKSHVLCLIAVEYAIQRPGSMVRFAGPTQASLKDNVEPIMKIIFDDCPKELMPHIASNYSRITFSNGSQIHFSGTDNNHHETLRGSKSDLNLVDEAGFMDNLMYIVKSILIPQTLTCNGFTVISSTPPKYGDHDSADLYKECAEAGDVSEFTIYDNTSITPEIFDLYAKEAGGVESTTFRREYLCQYVTDSEQLVIPEWKDEFIQNPEKDVYFNYYHKYVGMDTGVRDFTVALFAYYDFKHSTLIVEDEYVINGPSMTTEKLSLGIKDKEAELWGESAVIYKRIADNNNLQIIQDLSNSYNLPFYATTKTSLEAMVNAVRIMVNGGKLIVHPRCKQLLGSLKFGSWHKNSTDGRMAFGRSKEFGHYDALAALVYLIRNVDIYTNPIPATHGLSHSTMWINPIQDNSRAAQTMTQMFGNRRK